MQAAQPPTSLPTQMPIHGTANVLTPFANEQVVLTRQEYIQLQSDETRWAMFVEMAGKIGHRWYPEHRDWAFGWVQSIGHLYHLNDLRLQVSVDSPERAQAQSNLEVAMQTMADRRELELQNPKLAEPCQKVLQSMTRHWAGLSVFVRHSEVPMDNNTAERDMRGPVVGRKNFFGSGALWSGQLAATLYSLFATLKLHGINARTWMLAYLQACACNGGQAPKDLSSFLPWSMNEAHLQVMRASVSMAPMEPITPKSAAPPSPHPSRARSGGPAPPESQATPGQTANQTATQASTPTPDVDTLSNVWC